MKQKSSNREESSELWRKLLCPRVGVYKNWDKMAEEDQRKLEDLIEEVAFRMKYVPEIEVRGGTLYVYYHTKEEWGRIISHECKVLEENLSS